MKFNWNEKILDVSMREMRDFLNRYFHNNDSRSLNRIRTQIRRAHLNELGHEQYKEICKSEEITTYLDRYESGIVDKFIPALIQGGFLKGTKNEDVIEVTELGGSLANAKILRHSWLACKKQLDQFIERCKQANNSADSVLQIEDLWIFGSYLNPGNSDFGDVDIYAKISFRPEAYEFLEQKNIRGLDAVKYMFKEIGKLRRGLNIISLHSTMEGVDGPKEKVEL